MRLKDKIAVITGAGGGIGGTIACRFAREGAKVVIADASAAGLKVTEELVKEMTDDVLTVVIDVTSKQSVDDMVEKAVQRFGTIDILLNGAGIQNYTPFLEITEQNWDSMIAVNLKGYFLCGQAVAKVMVEKGVAGKIVNIASISTVKANPEVAHYCASKGGVAGLTRGMAVDLAQYNINVNAIGPGVIVTNMTQVSRNNPVKKELILNKTPLKRFGEPEEVANLALFLASSEASYITGAVYYVDGGMTAT